MLAPLFLTVPSSRREGLSENHCISLAEAAKVCAFHQGFEGYAPTPLVSLQALAARLGVQQILLKDEAQRFGLNAFKALGGSYAMAKYLCARLGLELGRDTLAALREEPYRKQVQEVTFVTATDGNHGRGVAWMAGLLGCEARVYLPQGSRAERLQNILSLGARAEITPWNYDEAVRYAARLSRQHGWILIQDTAWPGYETVPQAIMQGYTTMAREIAGALQDRQLPKPTHLFLQAGVGSMAAAVAGYFSALWQEECPEIIIVEPTQADCLYRTASADDGRLHAVTGPMRSMMAGLCCGEPSTLAWPILRDLASAFIACDDAYAALGMRLLASPVEGDPVIVSGESGAVTTGVLAGLMTDRSLSEQREKLGLDETSRILLISTEGDTDRENYRQITAGPAPGVSGLACISA